eukprot:1199946-Rhodomonas_salina.1
MDSARGRSPLGGGAVIEVKMEREAEDWSGDKALGDGGDQAHESSTYPFPGPPQPASDRARLHP